MKGIGLVFAGGGGKGAYEIGVWKYLHEIGLDKYVKAVSGTSVGALNAALFVGGTYDNAEKLWINIEPYMILTPKIFSKEYIIDWIKRTIGKNEKEMELPYGKVDIMASYVYKRLFSDCCFSRSGLQQMIEAGLDVNMINNCDISCYATCLEVLPVIKKKSFLLNDYNESDINSILLASSAIPFIFEKEYFDGAFYYDGGFPVFGDNIPINPLYDMGLEYIIVIHLKQNIIIEKEKYVNSKIVEIVPSQSLGDLISGTLDFTPEGARNRIEIGYNDAKKIMEPMVEMLKNGQRKQLLFNTAKKSQEEFDDNNQIIEKERNSIKQKMKNDGFDELYDKLVKGNKDV